MATVATRRAAGSSTVRGRRNRESHWAEGRRVAIFPDVPGSDFRPEHSMVITTDRRREIFDEVAAEIFNRLNKKEDNRPEWLMTGSYV